MVYHRFEFRDVGLHRFPQLVRANLIVAMYQHMSHPLYIIPIDFIMCFSILLCQHVNRFAYDFYVLDIAIENDGVGHHFFKSMRVLTLS